MKAVYINGIGCVSAQDTIGTDFLAAPIEYAETNLLFTLKPNYKAYIAPAAIRRLEKGLKNSIVASSIAMEGHLPKELDGIITGTGMGCILDSEKFLSKLIQNDEQYLTPTSFIQSTHNTVGGQIALDLKSKAYNFTYVHSAASFTTALIDAWMQINFENKHKFLVGGVDEIGEYANQFYEMIGRQRTKEQAPFTNLLNNRKNGTITGEGAAFFVVEDQLKPNTYAKIKAVQCINQCDISGIKTFISKFLEQNGLLPDDLDVLLLGNNGDDNFDDYYDEAEKLVISSKKVYFKHLFGEFYTAPAIALWIGSKIIKTQHIPNVLYKDKEKDSEKDIKHLLIFNQYLGKDLSLILLEHV